jgi:hypothetical protein
MRTNVNEIRLSALLFDERSDADQRGQENLVLKFKLLADKPTAVLTNSALVTNSAAKPAPG